MIVLRQVLVGGGVGRLAGLGGFRHGDRWRVFISHTSELWKYPTAKSYVAEVERAISAAGHVIVNMADFPAADQVPADLCTERVRSCEVYVGVLGTRYGTPVPDKPEVSYTELEFDTATEAGLDRLVFLLDPDAENVGIPPSRLNDREFGARQDAFRRKVQGALTTQSFASPAELGRLVERSLRELADTRARITSGIAGELVPAQPQLARASRFVNPPPVVVPTWFQNRQVEMALLARYVIDPGIALVMVTGRGGIGKTALVCRLLKGLEAARIPDVEGDQATIRVGGIVYLSRNGTHQVQYPTLVADLLRLVPADAAQRLALMYQDPHHLPSELMAAVLEEFPAGEPVVVLLDNLDSVMDTEAEALAESALGEALTAVLTAPAHAVTIIATTRVSPAALLKVEPSRQRQLRLDRGLGSPDAETVLRELDDDGRLELRDAPAEVLDGLRRHTRGFPRALEAVKAILDGDPSLTPSDLLDRTRDLEEEQVVQVLVGEAYELLDAAGKQVMQALAIFPAPVSAVGVDFLLRPVNPVTNAAPVLTRLVRRQLVRFVDQHYHLHPVDRDYARSQLPPGSPDDSPAAFTLAGLQSRAADYYSLIRTPPETWRTLEDLRPQLYEFELRCDAGDYDAAATVLDGIDFDYLLVWGDYRTLIDLHGRIHGRIGNPTLNASHLASLANCYLFMGDYRQAIALFSEALGIARDIGNRSIQGGALGGLGNCHVGLGEYREAIALHTEVLGITRDLGDRRGEGSALGSLGICHLALADYQQAIDLLTQALAIFRDTGDRQGLVNALVNLGPCYFSLGDYQRAIDLYTEAVTTIRDIGNRPGEGRALLGLAECYFHGGESRQAIDLGAEALDIARDIGDRFTEGRALANLGNCHSGLGEYPEAIELYIEAAGIARDIGDRPGEVRMLLALGGCYFSLGDYQQSIDLFTEAAGIARDIGDRQGEYGALGGLGGSYLSLGDYQRAIDLHTETLDIAREIGARQGEGAALGNLGSCHYSLGHYQRAIELYTEVLDILRSVGDRRSEGRTLVNLGSCHYSLGDYQRAIDLHTEALDIARDVGDRYGEANALGSLGQARLASGDPGRAVILLGQAASIADLTGDIEPAAAARSGLARAQLETADPAAALAATTMCHEAPSPTDEPNNWLLEGLALLELQRTEESVQAFTATLTAADALLTLTDRNVAALQARALALSGLAAATCDSAQTTKAAQAFARVDTITTAAGVTADTQRLFNMIVSHDHCGVLAEIRTARGW